MSTYTTIQGDVWDAIAYKVYGDSKYMASSWTPTLTGSPSLFLGQAWC